MSLADKCFFRLEAELESRKLNIRNIQQGAESTEIVDYPVLTEKHKFCLYQCVGYDLKCDGYKPIGQVAREDIENRR